MSVDDFEGAALGIVRRLRRRRNPSQQRGAWASIVSAFAASMSCDSKLLDVMEQEIAAHLRALRVVALRSVWATSDPGIGEADDAHLIPTSELRRLLAPELLARITELAVAEAAGHDARRRPNKPQQLTALRAAAELQGR